MPLDPADSLLAAARAQRDRFVGFAFAAADLLIEVARDGLVVFVAGATENLNGCSSEDLVGTRFVDLIAPADRAVAATLIGSLDRGGRLVPVTLRLARSGSPPIVLGGCRLPNHAASVFLSLSVATAPPASAGALSETMLSRDDFAGRATRRMLDDPANDCNLTLVSIDDFETLQGRLSDDVGKALGETVERYLRGAAADVEATGQLGNARYGMLHKSALDAVRLQQGVEAIAKAVDPIDKGVTLRSATLLLDSGALDQAASGLGGLAGADAARALVYCINQFADAAAGEFSVPTLRDGLDKVLASTVAQIDELRATVTSGSFDLVFQPIVELRSRTVHHLEALTRFRAGGSPESAVAFAEAVGLAADFDLAVCEKVIAIARGRSDGAPPIAINLSGRSLESGSFLNRLFAMCKSAGGLARRILFEVTETAVITRVGEVNARIQTLRAAGFKVCLDDFGAGANSFHYLRSFEVDFIKIDGAFGGGALGNPRDALLLRSIAGFCRDSGIATIGEKVENAAQAKEFEALGITHAQGYHFGKPIGDPDEAVTAAARSTAVRPNVGRRGVVTSRG